MIEPVFEDLAQEKKGRGNATGQVAFAKVDLGVGLGSMVAREYGVTATPTFGFFLDGKRVRAVSSLFLSLPHAFRHPLSNDMTRADS
jgi:thiol-disulfide isomerase/thioredoxin